MPDSAILQFRKLHGCGNDFVVIKNPLISSEHWPSISRTLCAVHFGIGADGLMVLEDFHGLSELVRVSMYNPDGSIMGMCGNGIRCLTRFLWLEGFVSSPLFQVNFDVHGRSIYCSTKDGGQNVSVDMGKPSFVPTDIGLASSSELISAPIEADGETFIGTALSMGNPHCVMIVPDIGKIDLLRVGPKLEHHPLFLARTNVEFAQILSNTEISIIIWERGAGPTLACGTGACASMVACSRLGLVSDQVKVNVPGGELFVSWKGEASRVFLEGPVVEVFSGLVTIKL